MFRRVPAIAERKSAERKWRVQINPRFGLVSEITDINFVDFLLQASDGEVPDDFQSRPSLHHQYQSGS